MKPQYIGYAIGVGIFLLAISWRLSRMRGVRPFNPGLSLIVPGVLTAFASTFFIFVWPFTPTNAAIVAAAFVAGAAIGWWRGKLMHIEATEAGGLTIQASPLAIVFLLALIAARFGLRFFLLGPEAMGGNGVPSPHALAIDGAFIAFAIGALGVARLEMFRSEEHTSELQSH